MKTKVRHSTLKTLALIARKKLPFERGRNRARRFPCKSGLPSGPGGKGELANAGIEPVAEKFPVVRDLTAEKMPGKRSHALPLRTRTDSAVGFSLRTTIIQYP